MAPTYEELSEARFAPAVKDGSVDVDQLIGGRVGLVHQLAQKLASDKTGVTDRVP